MLKKDECDYGKRKFSFFRDGWETFELRNTRKWGSIDDFKRNMAGVTFGLESFGWSVRYEFVANDIRQEGYEIKEGDAAIALVRSSRVVGGDYLRAIYVDYDNLDYRIPVLLIALVFEISWD